MAAFISFFPGEDDDVAIQLGIPKRENVVHLLSVNRLIDGFN